MDFCSLGHDCHSNATCKNLKVNFTCTCNEGFWGDGRVCEDIDECRRGPITEDKQDGHDCRSGTRCVNTPGSYTCECLPGHERMDERTCVRQMGRATVESTEISKSVDSDEADSNELLEWPLSHPMGSNPSRMGRPSLISRPPQSAAMSQKMTSSHLYLSSASAGRKWFSSMTFLSFSLTTAHFLIMLDLRWDCNCRVLDIVHLMTFLVVCFSLCGIHLVFPVCFWRGNPFCVNQIETKLYCTNQITAQTIPYTMYTPDTQTPGIFTIDFKIT